MSLVYFMKPVSAAGPIKIGHSSEPLHRLSRYLYWSPVILEIVATIEGDRPLERAFHAAFAETRLHHEWFGVSDSLLATIDDIKNGKFDPGSLTVKRRRAKTGFTTASIRASANAARLYAIKQRGIEIPQHVLEAKNTASCTTEEKLRRWAVVADFVALHSKPLKAAA